MKKILSFCDECNDNKEELKCECCGCSLCNNCNVNFIIKISDYTAHLERGFCPKCLDKLQLHKTKTGCKIIKKVLTEIRDEVKKKTMKINKKKRGKIKNDINDNGKNNPCQHTNSEKK